MVQGRRSSERKSPEGSHSQAKTRQRMVAVMLLLFAVREVVSEQVKLEGLSTSRLRSSRPFWAEHVRRSVAEPSCGVRRSPSHLIRAQIVPRRKVDHHSQGTRPHRRQRFEGTVSLATEPIVTTKRHVRTTGSPSTGLPTRWAKTDNFGALPVGTTNKPSISQHKLCR